MTAVSSTLWLLPRCPAQNRPRDRAGEPGRAIHEEDPGGSEAIRTAQTGRADTGSQFSCNLCYMLINHSVAVGWGDGHWGTQLAASLHCGWVRPRAAMSRGQMSPGSC